MKFYPFELHCHTVHSDGNFTPQTLIAAAKDAGLDGIALTDHNAVSGLDEIVKVGEQNGVVVLRGTEWTTFYGHLTVLGEGLDIDWRTVNPETVTLKAAAVRTLGGCAGIAHPCRPGYPVCTGGSDEWNINDYGAFSHFEVWSGLSPSADITNVFSAKRYMSLCALGTRLACVYGRDWHRSGTGAYAATYLGVDGALTAESALAAIKSRHTFISVGVRIDAELIKDGERHYFFGDDVPAGRYIFKGSLSPFNLSYTQKYGVSAKKITLLNGAELCEAAINESGEFCIAVNAKPGDCLQAEVSGIIEGERAVLSLASPFWFV
ncbi:MAG: CehA/McbA family metallohydrolase [Clostridiales bacterium]|jgi:hypothetical protein|nr:CehA/McbA family metallohydrolase [Clostridiales bacterium]